MKKLIKWIEESENRHWYTPFYGAPYGCKYINYSYEGVMPKSKLDECIEGFKEGIIEQIETLNEDEFNGEWNLSFIRVHNPDSPITFYLYLGGPGSGPPPPPPPGDDD